MSDSMLLDEKIFRAHVEDGPFQSGVFLKKWRLISINWPYVLICVSATIHEGWPSEYCFRFTCDNYPASAVTAQPWDLERKAPLGACKWPNGKYRVPSVFRPGWKNGQCLYIPCDRISIDGHSDWHSVHAHLIWKSSSDITLYLDAIYELLNSNDYSGPLGS